MKPAPNAEAEQWRISGPVNENYGAFQPRVAGRFLRVIASCGYGWDHVSVSLPHRCPTWEEMDAVKKLFFRDDETVMQLHVEDKDHINNHPFCLHLWRPQTFEEIEANKRNWVNGGEPLEKALWLCHPPIPMPPKILV